MLLISYKLALCELLALRLQDQGSSLTHACLNKRAMNGSPNHPGNVLFTSFDFMRLHQVLCRCYGMHLVEYEVDTLIVAIEGLNLKLCSQK